jgi:hypothetical protein
MTTPSTPTPTPSTTEQTTPVASISQHHRLKKLWNRLSEDGRAYWKDLFGSLGEHWLELERETSQAPSISIVHRDVLNRVCRQCPSVVKIRPWKRMNINA